MSKCRFLIGGALIFYKITIIICYGSEYDAKKAYDDDSDKSDFKESSDIFENKIETSLGAATEIDVENWTGRWFPDRRGDPTPPPKIYPTLEHKHEHRVPMGLVFKCDNGKTNLTIDWDGSPVDYTCYAKSKINPDSNIRPMRYSETIPPAFSAEHICMDRIIEYSEDLPVYGSHRPVWPVYGEYKYLPKQRWIHSLEHGAVVMLYHPCANPLAVKSLKKLVQGCLRRHVISPYNLVDEDRPLVLITWGHRLSMSFVDPDIVTNFIRETSLRGPEKISGDGRFSEGLISKSKTVTDQVDKTLCPIVE